MFHCKMRSITVFPVYTGAIERTLDQLTAFTVAVLQPMNIYYSNTVAFSQWRNSPHSNRTHFKSEETHSFTYPFFYSKYLYFLTLYYSHKANNYRQKIHNLFHMMNFVVVLFSIKCLISINTGCNFLLKLALILNTLESNTVYILNDTLHCLHFFFLLHFQHNTNVKTSEKIELFSFLLSEISSEKPTKSQPLRKTNH